MAQSKQPVFIAFQANAETQPLVDAIEDDNPHATFNESPGMVKIDCPGRLVIKRETVEHHAGRAYDLQELQINLISLSGELDETEDEFVLEWKGG